MAEEFGAYAAQHGDPCAVLHRALEFLLPLRQTVGTAAGDPPPITRRTLADVLVAADGLRTSELLAVTVFNHDLWQYVTELATLAVARPDTLDYQTMAHYLPFVVDALARTCLLAGCGLPPGVALGAREARRGVVTERIAPE